jgi:diaminohydroxyphosphoribosylaminopyrimidine deaminase/5-amino-6-(5-phosphoribosylamino)uracil reductase
VVFDRNARLPLTSTLVRTAREVPVALITRDPPPPAASALADAGVEIIAANSLFESLRVLRGRGVRSMLVEGGAGIAGALLAESLVDRLIIFRAPVVLGEGALPAFGAAPAASVTDARRWRIVENRALGDDTLTVYAPVSG